MKIIQIRNATMIIHIRGKIILVDPMFSKKGALPSLRYFNGKKKRNPTIELPNNASKEIEKVTHCLITHCQKGHFDHLDKTAIKWLRENDIPVICSNHDATYLQKKGLTIHSMNEKHENELFGGIVKLIPCQHGTGIIGKMMEHGVGYYIKLPNEPSLYIAGDTILNQEVRNCIEFYQPDVTVIPAGGAVLDIGSEIIMNDIQAIEVGRITKGYVIANHLEALDHCPVKRETLNEKVKQLQWQKRFFIPNDGETIVFHKNGVGA